VDVPPDFIALAPIAEAHLRLKQLFYVSIWNCFTFTQQIIFFLFEMFCKFYDTCLFHQLPNFSFPILLENEIP
jgi:hypothetical protein